MIDDTVAFRRNHVRWHGCAFSTPYAVRDTRLFGGLLLVLYDPDEEVGTVQFPNLVAFREPGQLAWTAELPTSTTGDRYYSMSEEDGAVEALSVQSYRCRIDGRTGRILSQEFFK